MSFTYDLSSDVGIVRLRLGDTTSGSGIRSSGGNFSDEEIQAALSLEGSAGRAAAFLAESLAAEWASMSDISVPGRTESFGQIADKWRALAKDLRARYGTNDEDDAEAANARGFSISLRRDNGYPDEDSSEY